MTQIRRIEPRLHVANVAASVEFYRAVLGFLSTEQWPRDTPRFAILNRDGVCLQLGQIETENVGGVTLWFDVDDIDGLLAMAQRHAVIEWGPETFDYGRRELAFRDPDGHLIILSEAAASR